MHDRSRAAERARVVDRDVNVVHAVRPCPFPTFYRQKCVENPAKSRRQNAVSFARHPASNGQRELATKRMLKMSTGDDGAVPGVPGVRGVVQILPRGL